MTYPLLYLDPWSGISGDMVLAALLDTDREGEGLTRTLHGAVEALGVDPAAVKVKRAVEWGLCCTKVEVVPEGGQPLRHLADMSAIIGDSGLPRKVRESATGAVRRLAEVEAGIHGCSIEEVHFHEVGGVDTLVDIVGAFALLDALGVEQVFVGPIPVGGGTVDIEHGRMGVPAPATAALLQGYEIVAGPEARELTTPTGALLVSSLQALPSAMPPLVSERVGYGGGTLRLDGGPNVLRVVLGRPAAAGRPDSAAAGTPGRSEGSVHGAVELQTNLDDASGEVLGHAVGMLRASGALDVWTVPAQMKKDRPGVVLHVLAEARDEDRLVALLFEQTGTLGIRRRCWDRYVAERGSVSVTVGGQQVAVKWGRWQGRLVSVAPEYESCAAAAAKVGLTLLEVMQQATVAARSLLGQEKVV